MATIKFNVPEFLERERQRNIAQIKVLSSSCKLLFLMLFATLIYFMFAIQWMFDAGVASRKNDSFPFAPEPPSATVPLADDTPDG